MTTHRDGTRPNPPLLGSLAYLVLNLPIGITSFVFVVTMLAVGVGTVVIWVGLAVLAVAVLVWRGAAQLERMRVHAMLGTYIASPYRPLPEGTGKRLGARLRDPATYKDMAYHLLMLPIGIAEFTIAVVTWSTGLYLLLLPVYYPLMPDSWQAVVWNQGIVDVDSWLGTLPWSVLGVLVTALAVVTTRAMGTAHARFARSLLGPSAARVDRLAGLDTAGVIDWTTAPESTVPR